MMKTSLQTITWGDPQHHLFDHIFGIAAELSVELEKLRAIALGCAGMISNFSITTTIGSFEATGASGTACKALRSKVYLQCLSI